MEVPKIVQELLDKKAEMSNTVDLDAYANGLLDMYQALQLQQTGVISSVFLPEWLTSDIRVKVKNLWDLPICANSNPRTSAIKLIREIAKHNGYEVDKKKSVELVKQHCL